MKNEYDEIFRMMGFDDTEDIARNYGSMPAPKASPAVENRPETRKCELPQISDAAYERATMEGSI